MADERARKDGAVEVALDGTILFEGHAYVVHAGQRTATAAGATLVLTGIDAASHARVVEEARAAQIAQGLLARIAESPGMQTRKGNA